MSRRILDLSQAKAFLAHQLNDAISTRFKELLETKHLYQNVLIADFEELVESFVASLITDGDKYALRKFASEDLHAKFTPSETETHITIAGAKYYPLPTLLVQNVKLYCSRCKQRETFSPTLWIDVSDQVRERHKTFPRTALHPNLFQLFVLVYQCEACRTIPVAFLVKRAGWKLFLEGRSPFEEVEIPKFMPKTEGWLFREAIIAAQTGNVLAGLFYLRSFIEQFARRQTGIKEKRTGEEILDKYQSLLSETQRDHMPSLRSWYERLSEPIHSANADSDLFEEAQQAIEEHFDFRRIYKIVDLNPLQPRKE